MLVDHERSNTIAISAQQKLGSILDPVFDSSCVAIRCKGHIALLLQTAEGARSEEPISSSGWCVFWGERQHELRHRNTLQAALADKKWR